MDPPVDHGDNALDVGTSPKLPAAVPSPIATLDRLTPASGLIASGGTPGLDLNSLLTMQLINMGQMQMQIFQSMFGTSALQSGNFLQSSNTTSNSPSSSQPTGVTAINSHKVYATIEDFFSQVSAKDPNRNVTFIHDRLMDDGLYRIDELLWFSEDELMLRPKSNRGFVSSDGTEVKGKSRGCQAHHIKCRRGWRSEQGLASAYVLRPYTSTFLDF